MARAKQFWLMKSEPDAFSFDDLMASKKKTTFWDGIRNYQARNFMRDGMQVGDGVVFYHSNTKPPGVSGFAEVSHDAYEDPTQFDPAAKYFDPKSTKEKPRWVAVEIQGTQAAERYVSLEELRGSKPLSTMQILQRGNRLSITPVTSAEWKAIRKLAGL
jgi:predicted RNA-binding protein with PUA-like domain